MYGSKYQTRRRTKAPKILRKVRYCKKSANAGIKNGEHKSTGDSPESEELRKNCKRGYKLTTLLKASPELKKRGNEKFGYNKSTENAPESKVLHKICKRGYKITDLL